MILAAKAVLYRRDVSERQYARAVRTVLSIAGALFSVLGAILAVGGLLSPTYGSAFYVLSGLGLIVSGALVARRHRAGAWTFLAVFAGTLTWSLRNVDVGSPLPLRLIGPFILLVMIAVLMPVLCQWRPRQAVTAFTLLIAGTIALGVSSLPNGPLARQTAAVTQFLDAETKGVLQ